MALVFLCIIAFVPASANTASALTAKTLRLATSPDVILCDTVDKNTVNTVNVSTSGENVNSYTLLPNGENGIGTTVCCYTGALFTPEGDNVPTGNVSGSDKRYNYCYYNNSNQLDITTANIDNGSIFYNSNVFATGQYGDCSGIADNCFYFMSTPNTDYNVTLNATFNLSQNVVDALADRLLKVSFVPYFITPNAMSLPTVKTYIQDSNPETCFMECFLYNRGTITSTQPKQCNIPITETMVSGNTLNVNAGAYTTKDSGSDCSFVQVTLRNFVEKGSCGMAFAEIGIKIIVTPNTGIVFDPTSTYSISGTDRNVKETTSINDISYASLNDVINFDMKLLGSGGVGNIYLDPTANQIQSGIMFKKLFSPGEDTLILEYFLSDAESGDMEVEQGSGSGLHASITILAGNANSYLIITAAIRYKNLSNYSITTVKSTEIIIFVDDSTPSEPDPKANMFYQTYINPNGSRLFFTATDNEVLVTEDGTDNVKALNIGQNDSGSRSENDIIQFKESCLDAYYDDALASSDIAISISMGSDLTIYYKSSYYGESYPTSQGEKTSSGAIVDVNNADLQNEDLKYIYNTAERGVYYGIYCEVTENSKEKDDEDKFLTMKYVDIEYGSLLLDMTYIDSKTNSLAYRKKGIWSIEFFTYDNVGNYSFTRIKYFIKVDITDYSFEINYFLGDNLNDDQGGVQQNEVEIYYDKITISGVLSGDYSNKVEGDLGESLSLSLFRGDKVSFLVRYTSKAVYDSYVLTSFQIGGGAKQPCTSFVFSQQNGRFQTYLSLTSSWITLPSGQSVATAMYTFEVNDSLCRDTYNEETGLWENNRVINFYFKLRTTITAVDPRPEYTGTSVTIDKSLDLSYVSNQVTVKLPDKRNSVSTTYYKRIPSDGTRYFVGEDIPETGVYVARNDTRAITSNRANEEFVLASGVYQNDVAYYERVNESGSNAPVHSGTYYCVSTLKNDSTYYGTSVIILTIRQGTPDLSTLYGATFNQGERVEINYGDSLAKIDWNPELDPETNRQTFNTAFSVFYEDDLYCQLSSNGILGYYKLDVTEDNKNSKEYTRPAAGLMSVRVVFTPIIGSYDLGAGRFVPQYDENGKFIVNTDYTTKTANVNLYVRPCTKVQFKIDETLATSTDSEGKVIFVYSGSVQTISYDVYSEFESQNGTLLSEGTGTKMLLTPYSVVSYASIPSIDIDLKNVVWVSDPPISAGLYAMRVQLADCNYTGSVVWYQLIKKIDLSVKVTGTLESEFQYEEIPSVEIKLNTIVLDNVAWNYSFYYNVGNGRLTYQEICVEENKVPDNALRNYVKTPYNAGNYIVKIDIVDNNYSGTGYAEYVIHRVNNNNNHASINWPVLSESSIVSGCHICYGQPLIEARLITSMGASVRYNFQTYTSETKKVQSTESIAGQFFIVSIKYDEWLTKNNKTSSDQTRKEYIAEMNAHTDDCKQSGYDWFMCFAVVDESSSHYTNFDFLYTNVLFKIGYASLAWDKVVIEPISYETVVRYNYSSAENSTITVAKKMAYVYSQNGVLPPDGTSYYTSGSNVYVYMSSAEYLLSLTTEYTSTFNAGTEYLSFKFRPTDTDNYHEEDHNIPLTINKKALSISLNSSAPRNVSVWRELEGLRSYYNYYDADDSYPFFTYSGNILTLTGITGQFTYTLNGKTYVKTKDYFIVTELATGEQETVTTLPASSTPYTVLYAIDNSNYAGTLEYTLLINKAPLQVSTQPQIYDEKHTLAYRHRITDLMFIDGVIKATYTQETVTGRYAVATGYENQFFGDAGTQINIAYVFTPDNDNYETLQSVLSSKTVNKSDVSGQMDLEVGTYVYSHGHDEFGALTRDFLKSTYSSEGKDESVDTYEEFMRAYFDYQCVVPEDLRFSINISISGSTDGQFVRAGVYEVTLSIDDSVNNYCGLVTTTLTVEKDRAYIVLSDDLKTDDPTDTVYDYIVEKTFDSKGMPQNVVPVLYDSEGQMVSSGGLFTNYYYNAIQTMTPSAIGSYEVRLSMSDSTKSNYILTKATFRNGNWEVGDTEITHVTARLIIGFNKSEATLLNITQVYSQPKEVNINYGINRALCSLEYVRLNDENEETGSRIVGKIPTEAGRYNIHMIFLAENNDGYAADLIWDEPFVIEKYVATILISETVQITYSGRQREVFTSYTEPYGMTLKYSYAVGDSDEYTDIVKTSELGAFHAGEYKIKAEIVNNNYAGTKIITLIVNKSALRIAKAPVFSKYAYHSEIMPTVVEEGVVYCPDRNDAYAIPGTYTLSFDTIGRLSVGTPTVTYTFTPSPDEFGYVDYAVVTGQTKLTIEKADYDMNLVSLMLNGKVVLVTEDEIVSYNSDNYEIYARFQVENGSDEYIYDYTGVNSDFVIRVDHYFNWDVSTPNPPSSTPSDIGDYTIKATVVSKNYKGTKTWTYKLIISAGEPVISGLETLDCTLPIGSNSSVLVSPEHNYFSGVTATAKNHPEKIIAGSFSVENKQFNRANRNEVTVTFTPEDQDASSFSSVSFTVIVNVIGKDAFRMSSASAESEAPVDLPSGVTINNDDWTSANIRDGMICSRNIYPADVIVSGTSSLSGSGQQHGAYIAIKPSGGVNYLYYGATLGQFSLTFEPCTPGCAECLQAVSYLSSNGVLRFEDDLSTIPDVGSYIPVVYILNEIGDNNQERYQLNNMRGLIQLGTDENSGDYILRKYVLIPKETESSVGTDTELIGFVGYSLRDNYRLVITDHNKIISANPTSLKTSLDDVAELNASYRGTLVQINEFISQNYVYSTLPSVALKIYTEVIDENIVIGKSSRVYNGAGITVNDLMISIFNTNVSINEDYFFITVYDSEGNVSDGVDIGTYTVFIRLQDEEYFYYGEKTVTFTIEKREISSEITLSKTTDTFGSDTFTTAPSVLYQGEIIPSGEVTVSFRLLGTTGNFVSAVYSAGTYEMKVVISSGNYYGERILTYTIAKKALSIVSSKTYIFSYGNERSENRDVDIVFSDGSDMEKTIYFEKAGYSRTTTVPMDAGEYTVTVVLADANYYLTNPSFSYVIQNSRGITVEEQPTIQTQISIDGETYHIKYGTKLSALNTKFLGGRTVIDNTGEIVSGQFMVDPASNDVVLDAGTQTVNVLFKPESTNYSSISFTMSVIVSRVDLYVVFDNISATYTRYGLANEVTYTVSGASEEVGIVLTFVREEDGVSYSNPVDAGWYNIIVSCRNTNYTVRTSTRYGSSGQPVFTIYKATVDEIRTERDSSKPVANSIKVGQNLMESALNNGRTFYNGFNNAVEGTYSFITAESFQNAGEYNVSYVFKPTESKNFNAYTSTVKIKVEPGKAIINCTEVYATYGTPANFSGLRTMFTTTPSNVSYKVITIDLTEGRRDKNGDPIFYDDSKELYMNANTYIFTCQVDDPNYEPDVFTFQYIVQKKTISMDFVNEKGNVVTAYSVLYGKDAGYGVKFYDSNDTTGKLTYMLRDADSMQKGVVSVRYSFQSRDSDVSYSGKGNPTELGSYTITATLNHSNYQAVATATYRISKGVVEDIIFDVDSLSKQVYGSVSAPIIRTIPDGVNYYVIYQGYDRTMPMEVGTYNITVYIDDISYGSAQESAVFKINPKALTISSYSVSDKVYDGTNTIAITGELFGVLANDEVSLTLRAATIDDSAEAGKHGVKITWYNLSGLKAENYILTVPDCTEIVEIKTATVRDVNSGSYMTAEEGFADGTGISFYEVDSVQNQTSSTSKAVGASSTIIGYTITVNGEPTITTGQYKICVEIPEEYRSTDFTVDFNGQTVLDPHREGDMYVFNTSVSSGQIVFSKSSFKYTYAIIIAAVVIVLIGIILVLVLNPMKKK